MAISWGAWSSNNRLRAGVEVTMSPSTITASTTSVTLTTKVYLQTRYASSEYGSSTTWWITGAVTDGSGNTDWSLGDMGYKLMGSTTTSVTLTSSTQAKSATGRIHSYYAYAGTDTSASTTFTVPARAVSAPAAPSAVSASRVSDTSQKVSWTRNATTSAPYDNLYVVRKDNVATSYVTIATLAGSATTYTDTTTRADRVYTYGVRARNAGGYSGYAYAANISTTPAQPGAPTASKTAAGDVTVARPTLSEVAGGGWEVWHAADGTYDAARLALLPFGTLSYTHTAPDPTKTHKYRIRAVSSSPTLYSNYSIDSNSVTPLQPPAAPTSLAPSGTAQEAAESATFTWTHNPLDTTAQTAYEVQYRPVGGSTWTTTGKVASTTSSRTWAANTWTNGQTIEWQVRTWGSHATASAWSASATLTLSTRPTATITAPTETVAWDSARLRVTWSYFDAEGQTQTGWKATLRASDGSILETMAGSDSATSVLMATRLADGGSYSVEVSVRDSTGLWSVADTVAFATDFATLPTPTVSAEFDVEAGACAVYVTVPVPVSPQVAPDSAEVWRSIDGGPWALVADNLVLTPLPPRKNVLLNPSFETDTTKWLVSSSANTTLTRDTTKFVSGAASVRIDSTATGYITSGTTDAPATPGQTWTGSMSLTGSGIGDLSIIFADSGGNTLSGTVYAGQQTLTGSWTRFSVTATAPPNTAFVRLRAYQQAAGTTQWWADAGLLEESPTLGSYFEGTQTQPSTVSITDAIPGLNASNRYKAVVETNMGAFGEGVPVEVFTSGAKHVFVNAGPGFAEFVRVNSNVEVQLSAGRSRALRRAAGRDLPVPFDGQQVTKEVAVSATLWRPDRAQARAAQASSWEDIADFALSYSPACFRDPDGNRVFVSMGPVRIAGLGTGAVRSVSWSMSATDFAEPVVSSTTL